MNPSFKINRLVKDKYKRPKLTYTDKLTKNEIEDKLEDYKKVDNIKNVKLGTHLRYFSFIDGKRKFRLGGKLINNSGIPKYIVLTNGINSWSVQVKNTIFFEKMTIEEIKNEYEEIIFNLEKKISKLEKECQNKNKN